MSFLLPNGPVPVYFVTWQTLNKRFATACQCLPEVCCRRMLFSGCYASLARAALT